MPNQAERFPQQAPFQARVSSRLPQAFVAMFMQIALGVLYSWSVFRGPLTAMHGWSKTQTIAPYRYSLLIFALAMIPAGYWQDRKGPRVVASVGGALLVAGCVLSYFFSGSVAGLILSYGVLCGMGVGFAYVAPIATLLKWYPECRGFIVGLAVMGAGLSPFVYGPLLEAYIGRDAARFPVTVPNAFLYMAVFFLIAVIGLAQLYKLPPAGWVPAGWTPPADRVSSEEIGPGGMVRHWQFVILWVIFFFGAAAGLTAIGESVQTYREKVPAAQALITAGTALGLMGLFNGIGRLFWGAVSDRVGRRWTAVAIGVASAVACGGLLRSSTGFWPVVIGLCLATFSYGGYFALMPSFTADFFGARNVGANYGLIFVAWGLCAYVVPGFLARIMDRARVAGNLVAGYHELYSILAVLSVVAAVLAVFLSPPRRRAARD
jgi:OFA family oxalate/formate antiporter-like MFS transporter